MRYPLCSTFLAREEQQEREAGRGSAVSFNAPAGASSFVGLTTNARALPRVGGLAKSSWLAVVCVVFWHPWAVAEPLRIFNVDVYVTGTPECQLIDVNRELRGTVSPFQENVMLGDVVTELARRAAQAGATVLHSIRLLSVTPFEGAQVAATASVCSDKSFGPFKAELVSALYRAQSARSFFFSQSESLGPLRSVENSTKVAGKELGGEALGRLRNLILSSVRNDVPGLRKSCPFAPSIGFQFSAGDVEAWWLVSNSCETGMLVSKSDDWRRSPLINLRPDALRNFEEIAEDAPGSRK
jgi:hypothetical protein